MLNRLKKLDKEGFTIIEVMIVLAIAGLIILIVLLAVPALQRNSRNTAIKNDASSVAGAISEFESNNDGSLPTAVAGTAPNLSLTGGAGTNAVDFKVQGNTTVKFAAASTTIGEIDIVGGKTCAAVSNTRAAAVNYAVEVSGGTPTGKCIDA